MESTLSVSIHELLQTPASDSEEQLQASAGEILLVGVAPSETQERSGSWSFTTRQGLTDVIDPEQFQRAQVWTMAHRKRFTSWLSRPLTIGRAKNCDVWIGSEALSKVHARFRDHGGQWEIADAGSRNGTKLNGKTLTPQTFHPVKDGDRINFAGVPCRIYSATKLYRILKFMKPVGQNADGYSASHP